MIVIDSRIVPSSIIITKIIRSTVRIGRFLLALTVEFLLALSVLGTGEGADNCWLEDGELFPWWILCEVDEQAPRRDILGASILKPWRGKEQWSNVEVHWVQLMRWNPLIPLRPYTNYWMKEGPDLNYRVWKLLMMKQKPDKTYEVITK